LPLFFWLFIASSVRARRLVRGILNGDDPLKNEIIWMNRMKENYEKDLDLNLLRVLVVVADEGSVTGAAARLYLSQPAVSAALGRLTAVVGAPLLERRGRGVALTTRGLQVVEGARPHLRALVEAAMEPPGFDPETSQHVFRVGFSDDVEGWLLPALVARLRRLAPGVVIAALPVQFRTVQGALERGDIDAAVTVADPLPPGILRRTLGQGLFVCLYCPASSGLKGPLTLQEYKRRSHVIVSYNGDLRGVVEDATRLRRRVACAVPRFASVGAMVEEAGLLATMPSLAASSVAALRPSLRIAPLPFPLPTMPLELLWCRDGDALRWLRQQISACHQEASAVCEARLRAHAGPRKRR
jgi:LysR family transcriptional activator of mexEF-oprN operon